tara:strand:+ start:57850 stop:58629 length:780 start_codon:yes stop_codon:yes gene_type:complete
MKHAVLPHVSPGVCDVFEEAVAVISHCADLASAAGCAPAAAYIAGAGGNVRRALAEIVHRNPSLNETAPGEFDVETFGQSEILSVAGYPDTIRNCHLSNGELVDVRALIHEKSVERSIWMRPTGELLGVQVRGRVKVTSEGFLFEDDQSEESMKKGVRTADLGRDIVASGLDLSARPTFAAALAVSLTTASWVHLASGSRWYADAPTARSVVRLIGGAPCVDARLLTRLGVCVDREVLCWIESLGWRHWPTTSARPTSC